MKIEIELITEEDIDRWKGWLVKYEDKYADGLCYEEMIGLVAALTMPNERPCLQWLKTREQNEASKIRFSNQQTK